MAKPDGRTDRAARISGWQAFCTVARAIAVSNDNAPTPASNSQEVARDAQRHN